MRPAHSFQEETLKNEHHNSLTSTSISREAAKKMKKREDEMVNRQARARALAERRLKAEQEAVSAEKRAHAEKKKKEGEMLRARKEELRRKEEAARAAERQERIKRAQQMDVAAAAAAMTKEKEEEEEERILEVEQSPLKQTVDPNTTTTEADSTRRTSTKRDEVAKKNNFQEVPRRAPHAKERFGQDHANTTFRAEIVEQQQPRARAQRSVRMSRELSLFDNQDSSPVLRQQSAALTLRHSRNQGERDVKKVQGEESAAGGKEHPKEKKANAMKQAPQNQQQHVLDIRIENNGKVIPMGSSLDAGETISESSVELSNNINVPQIPHHINNENGPDAIRRGSSLCHSIEFPAHLPTPPAMPPSQEKESKEMHTTADYRRMQNRSAKIEVRSQTGVGKDARMTSENEQINAHRSSLQDRPKSGSDAGWHESTNEVADADLLFATAAKLYCEKDFSRALVFAREASGIYQATWKAVNSYASEHNDLVNESNEKEPTVPSRASELPSIPEHAMGCIALKVEILRRLGDFAAAEKASLALVKLQHRTIKAAKGTATSTTLASTSSNVAAAQAVQEGHPSVSMAARVDALFTLGRIQRKMRKILDAKDAFEEALNLSSYSDSSSPPLTSTEQKDKTRVINNSGGAISSYNLAIILYYLGVLEEGEGQFDQALRHFRDALKLFRDTVGPDHRDTAECLNNIASMLFRRGDLKKAFAAYVKALSLKEAVYVELQQCQPDRPEPSEDGHVESAILLGNASIADTLYNLAELRRQMGRLGGPTGAVTYASRALEICMHVLGPDHPHTTDTRELLELISKEIAIDPTTDSGEKP